MNQEQWKAHWLEKGATIQNVDRGYFSFQIAVRAHVVHSTFGVDIADELIGLTVNEMNALLDQYNASV